MKIPGGGKLQRAVRKLQKRFASQAVILMYHRITEVDLDPWSLCVTPKHFAEHLEVLQTSAHPIALQQLAQAHRDGNIPPRAVAVTFDDGYADNLLFAKPLLEQYNIPATVFVTTGHIGTQREFWWDELERVLLQPGKLPEQLSLVIQGSTHQWNLGKAADYSADDYRQDYGKKAWEAKSDSRLFFYYSVWQRLQPLPAQERLQVLDDILTWADAAPLARGTHRSLLPAEVCSLAQGELVEIGAHTVTHPFLSAQSTALQRQEIQESKVYLEALLNRPVSSFAYPHGNYSQQTLSLIREAGIEYACSTEENTVWRDSDRFQLPRFQVHNWNGEKFTQQLLRWFHD
ncbi:MAG: polysaccharide deacetylase family protein [Nostocaceae cyanobacterium]|nr:polysaccharide deacetylase family protein [Nostocaceae cyanobacterium]